jgi:hypothetical protein
MLTDLHQAVKNNHRVFLYARGLETISSDGGLLFPGPLTKLVSFN